MAAQRHEIVARLVAVDAAEVRRHADRAADVGAELQRDHAGRQGRGGPAGGPARRAGQVVGIAGAAVDRIVALVIGQPGRDIGLAEDHRAGRLQPADADGVGRGHELLEGLEAPGGRQAPDVVGLLDRHRQAEQRAALPAGQGGVGGAGGLAGAGEVAHHHGVDGLIAGLDAGDGFVGQFQGADAPRGQGRHEIGGGGVQGVAAQDFGHAGSPFDPDGIIRRGASP